jgi:hypothetical protein
MARDITDRYERELQRQYEEPVAVPLFSGGGLFRPLRHFRLRWYVPRGRGSQPSSRLVTPNSPE